jgi:hypothetical protein
MTAGTAILRCVTEKLNDVLILWAAITLAAAANAEEIQDLALWEAGKSFSFDMGSKRVNWNHKKHEVYTFEAPQDFSVWSGLQVEVSTTKPRHDADVTVWLGEADGSWYHVKSGVPLIDPENKAVLLFEDFRVAEWAAPGNHMDEDFALDLKKISAVAIGVINPLGVGEVKFAVKGIELVRVAQPSLQTVKVNVTGKTLLINGHDRIPAGIFGGYAPDLPQKYRPGCQRNLRTLPGGGPKIRDIENGQAEAFHIDCMGDRYQPATYLKHDDWEKRLAGLGRSYSTKAKEAGYQAHVEFWNEPYLNWAGRSRKNYNNRFYREDLAREGGHVAVKRKDSSDEDLEILPHLKWRKAKRINKKTKKEEEVWQVYDPTAFTYWSGKGNGTIYDRMITVFGKAVKETNPGTQLVAGWGFRWQEDHWAAWDILYKPTIDRNIQYIDGLCEHHYQGEPIAMAASYEVLTAYGVTKHNKWLYSYNTETNNLVDAPARGAVDTPEKAKNAREYRRMVYNLRDLIYLAAQVPDKARARTVIHHNQTPKATEVTYGLLSNLRGRLIESWSNDRDIWCVSSVDGTDPQAMPKVPGQTLVAVVFNDSFVEREVVIELHASDGTTFKDGIIDRTYTDMKTFDVSLKQETLPASGNTKSVSLKLASRSAAKVALPLTGKTVESSQVRRRQFFSPDILQEVKRDKPFATAIKLNKRALTDARSGHLRLVVEHVSEGEGIVRIGNQSCAIPKALTIDNEPRIVVIPIDLKDLKGDTAIEFRVNEGNHSGYRVDMTSFVIEREGE